MLDQGQAVEVLTPKTVVEVIGNGSLTLSLLPLLFPVS